MRLPGRILLVGRIGTRLTNRLLGEHRFPAGWARLAPNPGRSCQLTCNPGRRDRHESRVTRFNACRCRCRWHTSCLSRITRLPVRASSANPPLYRDNDVARISSQRIIVLSERKRTSTLLNRRNETGRKDSSVKSRKNREIARRSRSIERFKPSLNLNCENITLSRAGSGFEV